MNIDDIERIRENVEGIELITPSIARWGAKSVHEDKKFDCIVKGLHPEYENIEAQDIALGRFINDVISAKHVKCASSENAYTKVCSPREPTRWGNTYV